MKLRSPLWYFGGKGMIVNKILPYIPEHKVYVEVFGGGASLLFAKEPSHIEVYNDIWSDVVNFFRVFQDEEKFKRFYYLVINTPYSRMVFYWYKKYSNEIINISDKATRFFVLSKQSFGGHFADSWGYNVSRSSRGMVSHPSSFLSTIIILPQIYNRLQNVQIENDSFEKIIERYDSPETFFYLDPPYIRSTRKSGGYKHEMTDEQHKQLVDMLLNIKGQFILSGYENEIYHTLNSICNVVKIETACLAAARTRYTGILGKGSAKQKQPRTEVLWIKTNNQQMELF